MIFTRRNVTDSAGGFLPRPTRSCYSLPKLESKNHLSRIILVINQWSLWFLIKIAIVGTFGLLGGCEFGKFAVELLIQKYFLEHEGGLVIEHGLIHRQIRAKTKTLMQISTNCFSRKQSIVYQTLKKLGMQNIDFVGNVIQQCIKYSMHGVCKIKRKFRVWESPGNRFYKIYLQIMN